MDSGLMNSGRRRESGMSPSAAVCGFGVRLADLWGIRREVA